MKRGLGLALLWTTASACGSPRAAPPAELPPLQPAPVTASASLAPPDAGAALPPAKRTRDASRLVLDATTSFATGAHAGKVRKRWEKRLDFRRGEPLPFAAPGGVTEIVYRWTIHGGQPVVERWSSRGTRMAEQNVGGRWFLGAAGGPDLWVLGEMAAPVRIGATILTPRAPTDVFLARLDASGAFRSAALLGSEPVRDVTIVGARGDRVFLTVGRRPAVAEASGMIADMLLPSDGSEIESVGDGEWLMVREGWAVRVGAAGEPRHETKLPVPSTRLRGLPTGEALFYGHGLDAEHHDTFFVGKLDVEGQPVWLRASRGDVDCSRTDCDRQSHGLGGVWPTPEGGVVVRVEMDRDVAFSGFPRSDSDLFVELDRGGAPLWIAPLPYRTRCDPTRPATTIAVTADTLTLAYFCPSVILGTCANAPDAARCKAESEADAGLAQFDRPKP